MSEHKSKAISLNIEYKMSILEELKEDTSKLQARAQGAVDDMNKVGDHTSSVETYRVTLYIKKEMRTFSVDSKDNFVFLMSGMTTYLGMTDVREGNEN